MNAHHRRIPHNVIELVALERGRHQSQPHPGFNRRGYRDTGLHRHLVARHLSHGRRPHAAPAIEDLDRRTDAQPQHPSQVRRLILREQTPS